MVPCNNLKRIYDFLEMAKAGKMPTSSKQNTQDKNHCDSEQEGPPIGWTSIWIGVLPTFFTSIMDVYIDMHLSKYYLEDICRMHQDKDCINPSRFGLINSFIRSLSLFTDFFSATIIDSSRFHRSTLLMCCAPIYWLSIAALFIGPSMYRTEFIPTFVWFTVCSLIKNMVPLRVIYDTTLVRMCKTWNVKERSKLFSVKHQASMYGNVLGAFLPTAIRQGLQLLFQNPPSSHSPYYVTIGSLVVVLSYFIMSSFSKHEGCNSEEGVARHEKKVSWIPSLRKCFENKAFLSLLYLFTYETLRGLLWNGLYIFYLTKVLNLEGPDFDFWAGVLNTVGMVFAMIFAPVWQYIASKYGNYNAWIFSYILQVPIGVFVYLAVDNTSSTSQIWVYLPFFVLLTVTGRASGFLLDGIKTTVFDYDELRTGERREVSIEATWSLIPRYVDLLSSSVSFGILSYCNQLGSDSPLKSGEYTLLGKKSIAVQAALLPSLTSIGCLFLMYTYPINDEKHAQVLKAIKDRKEDDTKPIIDPITNEKIVTARGSNSRDEFESEKNYFFSFELTMLKDRKSSYVKWMVVIETTLSSLLFLGCGVFGYYFVLNAVEGKDMWATLFLWLSSVTFTWGGFHFSRIDVANNLKNRLLKITK